MRVLITDLMWMTDPLEVLRVLGHGAAVVFIVQVLAEQDTRPLRHGSVRLVDSETQELREVFIDAAAQQRYREALSRHQEQWRRACTQRGAALTTLVAEPLLQDWDLRDLVIQGILRVQ